MVVSTNEVFSYFPIYRHGARGQRSDYSKVGKALAAGDSSHARALKRAVLCAVRRQAIKWHIVVSCAGGRV